MVENVLNVFTVNVSRRNILRNEILNSILCPLDSLVPCVDFNPCQNDGVCVASGSSATCQCNTCMYTGQYCETGKKHNSVIYQ